MLLVDPRSGANHKNDLLGPIKSRLNGQAEHFTLPSGDFAFEGSGPDNTTPLIGIELKTVEDLVNSSRTGRYQEQLKRMEDDYQFIYLLAYGVVKPSDEGVILEPRKIRGKTEWFPMASISREQKKAGRSRVAVYHWAEFSKFCFGLEIRKNVNVIRASSILEATWDIVHLYQWWQKPWDQHMSTEKVKVSSGNIFRRPSTCLLAASQLPGVGEDKARALAGKFGTVERLVSAGIEELMEVEGIGKKTAEGIWKAVREEK